MNLPFQVGTSPTLKIRGIIATEDLKKDQIIEKCPVILVELKKQEEALMKTVLQKYYFEWTQKYHVIVLGYGSLINHSYSPNARYDMDYKNKVMVFKAIKSIQAGEEITVNYNWYPTSKDPVEGYLVDYNEHLNAKSSPKSQEA